jgi:hypothetical protein
MGVRFGCLVLLAGALSGCPNGGDLEGAGCYLRDCSSGGGPGSGGGAPVTFCDPTPIFSAKCAGGACHGSASIPPGGVNLFEPADPMALGQALLDVPARYVVATYPTPPTPPCPTGEESERYIDSRDPGRSLILTKVKGVGHFACGAPMPGIPLVAADIQCIDDWVHAIVAAAPAPE